MRKLEALLNSKIDNKILPFFWQHGEDEATLRKYMDVIDKANIKAVCVESRPHPDYVGPKWWEDMDIILDEAKKREMKVWILDDSHFPSGYANGAVEKAGLELRREFIAKKKVCELANEVFKAEEEYLKPEEHQKSMVENFMMKQYDLLPGDECLGFVAVNEEKMVEIKDGDKVNGKCEVYGLYRTKNRGPHRDFINMCDKEAVRLFIDTVYEPHYAHYKEYFGNVIEGFFSDEPEIGNGHLYESGKKLQEMDDLPFSREIETALKEKWGLEYLRKMLSLFVESEYSVLARIEYMDIVTECVKHDFSYQIGDWCREHGVKYIGHLIEDHNQHSRTGSSLGHYFRGLKGQSWAGIDDIGGQVIPQQEDAVIKSKLSGVVRDGVFYHFTLGKLAPSAASIDPLKKGDSMCEIFGAYGWEEGVYLEKYLIDHFMVRGVNHYVPHAFSALPFPDPDCPPHFYAHGNNPQYQHFGELMKYTNRVCNLISDGKAYKKVAVLYHGEADWTGLDFMKEDVITRILIENQIDFDLIPSDIFYHDDYQTEIRDNKLCCGLAEYEVVIIPEYPVIRKEVVDALNNFESLGGRVYVINKTPKTINDEEVLNGNVISLDEVIGEIEDLKEIKFSNDAHYLRAMHYQANNDVYYFVNEDQKTYLGELRLPILNKPVIYDAWLNKVYALDYQVDGDEMMVKVEIEPRKSLIIYADGSDYQTEKSFKEISSTLNNELVLKEFTRSSCLGIEYPNFKDEKKIVVPDNLEEEMPKFGGFVKYESEFELHSQKAVLEIDDLLEGVEVYLNGQSLGIQIVPKYQYDLSSNLKDGVNKLTIVSATTLERFVEKKAYIPGTPVPEPTNQIGLKGKVLIKY